MIYRLIKLLERMNNRECAKRFFVDLEHPLQEIEAVLSDYEGVCEDEEDENEAYTWIDLGQIARDIERYDNE